jgi:FAD/FMN-containing dehydrogenase/Fe-S oxidoreductase
MTAREIPFNYTSADDHQVIRLLLGDEAWDVLERLRMRRVTGRSARLLLRFFGEAFLLRRNPFLFQELVDDAAHRRAFVRAAEHDLAVVAQNVGGDPETKEYTLRMVGWARDLLRQLLVDLSSAPSRQARLKSALGAVVGPAQVHTDPFTLNAHATDATDWRAHLPVAVAFATDEAQVPPLLEAIAALGLKAVPRGAGTGLTGGAVPLEAGCVIVNTERLDKLFSIAQEDLGGGRMGWVLDAGAGLVTEKAIQAAAARGLVFATDPTSAWACTLGGNLAENAGGKSAVQWGTAIDNALRWTLALSGGRACRIRRLDHPLRKILPNDELRFEVAVDGEAPREISLRGSEIRKRGLWKDVTNKALGGLPGIQKEGTDGVITRCAFVLHAAFPCRRAACVEFFSSDMEEAGRAILSVRGAFASEGDGALLALEHFDDEYVAAIGYRVKAAREGRPKAVLLIDVAGRDPEELARGVERLRAALKPHATAELFIAADEAQAAAFWADRKKFGAIARRTNAFKLNEDVVLPVERLAEFARAVEHMNLSEERHNHAQTVESLRAWALAAEEHRNSFAGPRKAPAIGRLCDQARREAEGAAREALRGGLILRGLAAALEDLFTGVPGAAGGASAVGEAGRLRLIVAATHMHAGDGNVHVNIPVFSNDRGMMLRAQALAEAVMRLAVELGGSVSGEHGIGITKASHLSGEARAALDAHRALFDPRGLMNPGKLRDARSMDRVFTPSFNLLNLEARILQHDQLELLSKKIQSCVRCGKCKPDCCVFIPSCGMFYHPRNKNLAIGAIIEALLYDAQRSLGGRFDVLKHLQDVSDHCTLCHKCLKPCPVDIDTGEVSILEREILRGRKYRRTALPTALSLSYLSSRSKGYQAAFQAFALGLGVRAQRAASRALSALPLPRRTRRRGVLGLVDRPLPLGQGRPLPQGLPDWSERQALVLKPAQATGKAVFYFPGCGSERLHGDVGRAVLFNLLQAGATVVLPPPSLCCGFPFNANAKTAERRGIELRNAIIFSQIHDMLSYLSFDAVVLSCGTCMESLEHLAAGAIFDAPLVDASAWALGQGLQHAPLGELLYHRPCHDSLRGQGLEVLSAAGAGAVDVPACCGEAGTLALSRPDISGKLFDRKEEELRAALAERPAGKPLPPLVTNCPACLQGLGRQERLGLKVEHLAVRLAKSVDADWEAKLEAMVRGAEAVTF